MRLQKESSTVLRTNLEAICVVFMLLICLQSVHALRILIKVNTRIMD